MLPALPHRIFHLFKDILRILHSHKQPISFAALRPSSIRRLLQRDSRGPDSITARIFPHLRTHPNIVPPPLAPLWNFSYSSYPNPTSFNIVTSAYQSLLRASSLISQYLLHYITLPLQLTSQEIYSKRLELERVRNERAEALGELTSKHDDLSRSLRKDLDERATFLQVINQALVGQHVDMAQVGQPTTLLGALATTSSRVLPIHVCLHTEDLRTHSLLRPSRLIRLWPRLLILPPLMLYAIQRINASQDTLLSLAKDAWETVKGFWRGWLVEPLADIVRTVRTGGEDSIIVQRGSIEADLQVFIYHPPSFSFLTKPFSRLSVWHCHWLRTN